MSKVGKYKQITGVFLVALILRLISIKQSLWIDEATTAQVTNMSLREYFSKFALGDFHPPIFYLFEMLFAKVFGMSEPGLRAISVLSGIGLVGSVYLISETVKSGIGIYAGAFAATSGLLIYYSQEARMYMLVSFFVSLSVYFFLKLTSSTKKLNWIGFGVFMTLASLTHYLAVFALFAFWVYAIIMRKDAVWWKKFLLSHMFLAAGWILWLPVFYGQFISGLGVKSSSPLWWSILGQTSVKEIALIPAKFIFGRITVENNFYYGLLVGVASLIYGLIILVRRPCRDEPFKVERVDKSIIVWLWLFVPFVLSAVLGLKIPVFSYFRLLYTLPSVYILLALGVVGLPKKWQNVAIVFVLSVNIVSSSVYLLNSRFQREDWRGLVDYILAESQGKNAATIFAADSQMEAYEYYFNRGIGFDRECCSAKLVSAATFDQTDSCFDTIWLIRYVQPVFDSEDKTRFLIEEIGYKNVSEHDFNGVVVWRYEK